MNRKRVIIYALVAAGVCAVIGTAIWVFGSQDSPSGVAGQTVQASSQATTSSPTGLAPTTLPLTEQNVQKLENALNSPDKTEQAQALIPALRADEWAASAVLPDGATLRILRESFAPYDASGNTTVKAVVTGSVQAEFNLGLVLVDGQWLIYTTEKVR